MSQHIQEAKSTLQTITDLVRWAISQFNEAEIFFGHGTQSAWDEAVALIFPLLNLDYDLPNAIWQARLTPSEISLAVDIIDRRITERIPSAYLTNNMYFADLTFYVDQRVLIPRSPIAELIKKRCMPWLGSDYAEHILDLCTGSACIAVACAHYFPEARVDAIDLCQRALEVAEINVKKHDLQDRINFYQGNLFSALPEQHKYDVIISNPPYVDHSDMLALPPEYLHEPTIALTGGSDGLDIVKCILSQAKNYLKPEGILIVEVGNSETALIEQYPQVPFTWLEFEHGDDGVFLLTYQDLIQYF